MSTDSSFPVRGQEQTGSAFVPKEAYGEARRLGIVLLQLGGPESLDDVQPFLEDMFGDPDLFNLPIPGWLQQWVARRASCRRASSVRSLYASIGGKSPIGDFTRQQAKLLESELNPGLPSRVFVAMRYGRNTAQDAIAAIRKSGCDRILLLPLFPQYCAATTGSSINEWNRHWREAGLQLPTQAIDCYYSSPLYIQAVVERIDESRSRLPAGTPVHLVFSAHGLPLSFIRRGDPYQRQIEETVRLVVARCRPSEPHTLCYQSRVGPQRWLEPSLTDTLRRLGESGTESVLVVPISFVSDHLETLSEIDIEARQHATEWGVRHFATMPGLNDSLTFIRSLAALVRNTASRPQ